MSEKHTTLQPEHKNGHKPEPAVLAEQTTSPGAIAELSGGLLGAQGSGNLENQKVRLGNPHWHVIQRQALAAQIGHAQGNQHLQGIVRSLKHKDDSSYRQNEVNNPLQRAESVDVNEAEQVRQLMAQGEADENKLTNELYYRRHEGVRGIKLQRGSAGAREWLQIRNTVVRPALGSNGSPSSQATANLAEMASGANEPTTDPFFQEVLKPLKESLLGIVSTQESAPAETVSPEAEPQTPPQAQVQTEEQVAPDQGPGKQLNDTLKIALDLEKELRQQHADYGEKGGFQGYGTGQDQYVCTTFAREVLKRAGYDVSGGIWKQINVSINWQKELGTKNPSKEEESAALKRLVEAGDPRTKGIVTALVESKQGVEIPVDQLQEGDFIQYWYPGKDGGVGGHVVQVRKVIGGGENLSVDVHGSHGSTRGVDTIRLTLRKNGKQPGRLKKVYCVRPTGSQADQTGSSVGAGTQGTVQRQTMATQLAHPPEASKETEIEVLGAGGPPGFAGAGLPGNNGEGQDKKLGRARTTVQFKLTVNEPGDEFEQEADQVADSVMRAESAASPPDDDDQKTGNQPASAIQASGGKVSDVASKTEGQIQTLRGNGSPLPEVERAFFEERIGADFSQVRVHTGDEAVQTARDLGARAYTTGSDIVFNAGEYQPGTNNGRRLLAHELTHVVQQGAAAGSVQRQDDQTAQSPVVTPSSPAFRMPGIFGDVEVHTYAELLRMSIACSSLLRDSLREVDQSAPEYSAAQEWLQGIQELQPSLRQQGDQPLSEFSVAQAELWLDDLEAILDDIQAYKRTRVRSELQRVQETLEAAAARLEEIQPELDEALRQSFLSEDEDIIGNVANMVGNITDIGLGLRDLSRDIVGEIHRLANTDIPIPAASNFTRWLEGINRTLAAFNLVWSLAHLDAPTEYGRALNRVNALAGVFSAGGTLFNLAPHIGLYANLYLVPLTQAIVTNLNRIISTYIHDWNMVAVEIGLPLDVTHYPGSWGLFSFILPVMHAEGPDGVPWPIPREAKQPLLQLRDRFEAGTGAEMPTTGWWLWRDVDDPHIKDWVFYHRRRIWALLYGRLSVPELDVLERRAGIGSHTDSAHSRSHQGVIQRFEAQHHEHIERGALTTPDTGGQSFTDAETSAVYFGNWSRDWNQAFVNNPVTRAIGNEMLFEIVNVIAIHKFGRQLRMQDFGVYSPREHIDNPAGQTNYDLLRDRQMQVLQMGAGDQARTPGEDISSPEAVSRLFVVNEAGLPAYLGRSVQYVEEEFTRAADLGRTEKGLTHFGNGLHTVEDLFAHSNFIEIAIGKLIQEGELPIDANLSAELRSRSEGGLDPDPIETFSARTTGGRPILTTGSFVTTDTLISLSEAITAFLNDFAPFSPSNQERNQQTMEMILGRYEALAQSGQAGTIIRSFLHSLGSSLTQRLAQRAREQIAGDTPDADASLWERAVSSVRGAAGAAVGGALGLAGGLMDTGWVQNLIGGAVNRLGQLPLVSMYRFTIRAGNAIDEFFNNLDQRLQGLPFYNEIKNFLDEQLDSLREMLKIPIQAAVRFVGDLIQRAFAEVTTAGTNIEAQIRQQIEENVQDPTAREQLARATPEEQRAMVMNNAWSSRACIAPEDLERLRQMILTPDYVRAGPSHSQIAKDHADSPFFGSVAALAGHVDTTLRDQIIDVWESEGRNTQTDTHLQQDYASEIPQDIRQRLAPPGTPENAMTEDQREAERDAIEAAPHYREYRRRQEGELLLREGGLEEGEESHGVEEAIGELTALLRTLAGQVNQMPTRMRQLADQLETIAPDAAMEIRALADEMPCGLENLADMIEAATTTAQMQRLVERLCAMAREQEGLVGRAQTILHRVADRVERVNLRDIVIVAERVLPMVNQTLLRIADSIQEGSETRARSEEQLRRIHSLAPVSIGTWDEELSRSHAQAAPGQNTMSLERQTLFNYVRNQLFQHPYDTDWWRQPLLEWCLAPHNRLRLVAYIRERNAEEMHHHH